MRAELICLEAQDDALALVERYPTATRAETLRFLEAAGRLTTQVVRRLERLGPAPNRHAHRRLMRELRLSLADYRRTVAALRRGWNTRAARRLVGTSKRDRVIVRLFRQLGAPACAGL